MKSKSPLVGVLSVALMLASTGCTQWTGARDALVDQSLRAVSITSASIEDRAKQARSAIDGRRVSLDRAFEQDVETREARQLLDQTWVIEHGRLYAKSIDQLRDAREQQARLDQNDRENLLVLTRLLEELRAIHAIEQRIIGAKR